MALCINQSGTWRNITTLCVNQSGTWRRVGEGWVNQSNTWRRFLCSFTVLGCCVGGGRLICRASGVCWIVAPAAAEVSRNWHSRNDAVTRAQQVSGGSGWFVPSVGQLQNPGYVCRTYWDSFSSTNYWSTTESNPSTAYFVNFVNGFAFAYNLKESSRCVRAFRCVTY